MKKLCIETKTEFNVKEGKTYKSRCLYATHSSENELKAILQVYNDETKKIEYIINTFQTGTEEFAKFKERVMCGRECIDFTDDLCNVVGEYTCGQCKFNIVEGYPQINLTDIDFFEFVPQKKVQYDRSDDKTVLSPDYLEENKHYKFFVSNAIMQDNNIILEYFIYVDKDKKQICYITETYDIESACFKELISALVHSHINIRLISVENINYHGEACFYSLGNSWHINIDSIKTTEHNTDELDMALTVEFVENSVIDENNKKVYLNTPLHKRLNFI